MGYLLRTNTSYKHLAKKFERAVLTRVGRDGSEMAVSRGGVEDTRLEAKDTKKNRGQGQGQPFRGQTLSRPRTGTLEAKDHGHKRKCSPKSQKFFR